MADPPSTVYQSFASGSTAATANVHIPDLPNEVLCSIAGFVDDAYIPNLRLAAKVFHYITAERFATVFFQDRAYELSPAGLKALVKITEHPVFAPYIRTIIIGHGGKHHSAKYHDRMESAFRNLKLYGHKISLGLRRVCTAHNFEVEPDCAGTAMSKFSEKMIFAAKKAQMPIENFIADLQNPLVDDLGWKWVFAYLSMSRTTLLKSCEFGNLWHGKDSLWLEGGDKTIRANTQAQVITVLSNLAAGRIRFSLDD
ncbi:hypothetical protein D6D01_02140 [Aureobasidium pullulans]|uniref:F-box domain-containing protein n=1 Tax=Aureobasidium pullulans TaxID=5580 RepID=A0A4S9LX40_AURPU|nr:hypothetical protein D6D01_02140 [Aureobasidium pullulans]